MLQLVDIASSIPEGKGQLARAYFKLSTLHAGRGREDESATYKAQAEATLAEIRPDLRDDPFEEQTFMKLCLWMLW